MSESILAMTPPKADQRIRVYLRLHAEGFGFDESRMAVTGHSAGGRLAICLAGHEPTITRAVSLAGVLDVHRAFELHLSNDAVVEFLGGTPEQVPEFYRDAEPLKLKVAARQAIVTGDADDVIPPEFSREYVASRKAGEQVELLAIPNAGHFELIGPRTEAFKDPGQAFGPTANGPSEGTFQRTPAR